MQLVKSLDLQSVDYRLEPHHRRGVFFWHEPLASLSLQIASLGSDHHEKENGGPN